MKKINLIKLISIVVVTIIIVSSVACVAFAVVDDEQITVEAMQLAETVEAEGIVLLKNENNFLPLESRKLNIFGIGTGDFLLSAAGGSGSASSDSAVDLYTSLENAGIEYNKEILEIYDRNLSDAAEISVSKFSKDVIASAKNFSDTAVLVFCRVGQEGNDFSADELRLSDGEKSMLEMVCNNFENVIIMLNVSNTIEMSWLEEYDSIKAAMLVWMPGEVGAIAIGKMLTGEVTPSGRLPDTIAYNIEEHPSSKNFGEYAYSNTPLRYFVEYEEGIYVGYRYFETFAPEKVQYPFGFGLSYTTFEWETTDYSVNDGEITITVRVINTGDFAGKDVVQVYFSAPYNMGGIEKSAIELAGYAKTSKIAPGESDSVTITFDVADMASYDEADTEAWVLENGIYEIKISKNVRDTVDTFEYCVEETEVYKYDDVTGNEISNLFEDANGKLTYFSRSDMQNTYPTSPDNFIASDDVINADKRCITVMEGAAPRTNAKYDEGVITLEDVYNDESLWDAFLDQLTVNEMITLVTACDYRTAAVDRLGIPATIDNDGPASIKGSGGFLLTSGSGVAYPSEIVFASTWNDELAERFGITVGKEAAVLGTNVWYAPACNIHRSPLGGRNYEYYSEDPLLSGKMAAAVIRGAQSQNLVTVVKHFAANEQETKRMSNGLYTWSNEQALREIYLEAFEIAIKEGNAIGVMSAYNRIGTTWCSANKALLYDLLRVEWGFDGYVLTDANVNINGYNYMDPVLSIYAHNDAILTFLYPLQVIPLRMSIYNAYLNDPAGLGIALRECVYNICKMKMRTNAFLNTYSEIPSCASGKEHNFDTVRTSATCYHAGYCFNACKTCGYSYFSEGSEALKHLDNNEKICDICQENLNPADSNKILRNFLKIVLVVVTPVLAQLQKLFWIFL